MCLDLRSRDGPRPRQQERRTTLTSDEPLPVDRPQRCALGQPQERARVEPGVKGQDDALIEAWEKLIDVQELPTPLGDQSLGGASRR